MRDRREVGGEDDGELHGHSCSTTPARVTADGVQDRLGLRRAHGEGSAQPSHASSPDQTVARCSVEHGEDLDVVHERDPRCRPRSHRKSHARARCNAAAMRPGTIPFAAARRSSGWR